MAHFEQKYSRGIYDKATKRADDAGYLVGALSGIKWANEEAKSAYFHLLEKAEKARSRVEQLYERSHSDAVVLNDKYNEALNEMLDAKNVVLDFNKNGNGVGSEECERIFSDLEKAMIK